ncbi:hypothetical protein yaldo0001_11480 [Yersinia aldovae ATCC 35236]|uniref:Transmembrane protein n=1 Tax=Yersinia aldovae TaxID=29483 RepID=A0A0T9TG47_YERAL|nr:DUF924 family protein [Yersinia aldovae]EEP97156.1 hypothetical protein yaldo0001_11480 [Yersinia aldovae ATCC 35236]CNJ47981.1 putative transmembrane protein [Yersinia aldovae]CNK80850.1 putative transmembrane protein [Yersinia aldovae]CNK85467.1 putative transmembrane protein [Yersinia aldovae]
MDYQTILKFWFSEMDSTLWFKKDEDFDTLLRQRFGPVWQAASKGELASWRQNIEGRLAEILILDQFSRNLFRDLPASFSCDGMALVLAQEAISRGQAGQLSDTQRGFLYLPFMHSESALIHQQALELYTELGNDIQLDYELRHKAIIDRFGRYPHRNLILGRVSSAEEQAFLLQPGSAF